MTVKIMDVARYVGVSSATVSRVISHSAGVRPDVRARVLAAMEELGYQPNRVARSLRVQRSTIIGLIISDIQNPFFITLVRAVEDIAYQNHFAIFLCNTDEDVEKEKLYIDLMQAERVAGVIISPSREKDDPCKKLIESRVPVVVIDRKMSDVEVDTVVVDNKRGAYALVDHLVADGHRRIGAVLGTLAATTGRERKEGYIQALTQHDLPFLPELLRIGRPQDDAGYQLTKELLALPLPPSALFTGNNLLTVGALKAIQEQNLRIPDDIALVAFDGIAWMSVFQPEITRIQQPTYAIGQTAARLLLQRIADSEQPVQQVVLEPELIVRQSCAHHEQDPLPTTTTRPILDTLAHTGNGI
ncbi:MAG: substrate-binding domain-containing protein [Ktedonobacteraceae bacterium]